ncbi:MAG: hypothetical protein ABIB71_02020 [Candidatus Woesearchaeota archaeon]
MVRIRSADSAKKALQDCAQERHFWLSSNKFLKNLNELASALEEIEDSVYKEHAKRGDFSNWVMDVIGDETLAKSLSSARNRQSAAKKVRARCDFLQNLAQK